jgi:hypothetical protein|nr:hypothetical protein [Oxalobacteraceae bacterium]
MIVEKTSEWIRLTPQDPGFRVQDGIIMVPRAGIELSDQCPKAFKDLLIHALDQGWVQPVARVHQHDYLIARLKR